MRRLQFILLEVEGKWPIESRTIRDYPHWVDIRHSKICECCSEGIGDQGSSVVVNPNDRLLACRIPIKVVPRGGSVKSDLLLTGKRGGFDTKYWSTVVHLWFAIPKFHLDGHKVSQIATRILAVWLGYHMCRIKGMTLSW